MHIKRLEIDNFKSFANKTEIPFLTGFTAIAGMNGSGKSNIIDSILFALGLSSTRALRTEKGLADLISTHNQRNEASVKVVFDLDDGKGGEISFSRKIKKTNSGYVSTCYMDDKPQTLAQVHSELEKYQITPNSYNVIMQGDVASLINCSSVERRNFIDEIAGTADFDRKIKMANDELNAVENTVQTSNLLLADVQTRVAELKEEKEVALKYRALREEKDGLEQKITLAKYFDFKKTLDNVHMNILEAQKNQKLKEKEMSETEKLIAGKKQEYDDICAKVKAQGEDKQLEVKRQAEEKKGEIQRKKNSVAYTENLIYQNNKTIENIKKNMVEMNLQKENLVNAIKVKELQKEKLQAQLKEQEDERAKILEEQTGLSKTADKYIEKRSLLRKEADKLKEEETAITKEKYEYESKLSLLNTELKNATTAKEGIIAGQEAFQANKEKYEFLTDKLTKETEDLKLLQKLTFESLDKTKNEAADAAHNIQLSSKKIFELEAKEKMSKSYGVSAPVEFILNSGLKGVHAPVSELVDMDAEYAVALNKAMGAKSRCLVVEDEHVAVRGVELLKSAGRGVVTFLPLNKMRHAPSRLALPKEKGVIDFAVNLAEFDDIYLDVMYFVFGETLIVENMETAKKLMGKFRIITLDGEIFDKSGAITGGKSGKDLPAFSKIEEKELLNYKKRLAEFEKTYAELEHKKTELDNRLEKIKTDYSNALNSKRGAEIELNALISNNSKAEELLEKHNLKIKELEPEIKSVNSKLDKLEEKHSSIMDKILKITDEITEVEKFIDDSELSKLKELTKDIEEKIRKTEKEIANVENEIVRDTQSIRMYDTVLVQKQADMEKAQENIEGLLLDKEKFKKEAAALEEALVVLEKQVVELGKNLAELQGVRQTIHDALLKTEKDKNIIENEIDRIKEQIESAKTRRTEIEPQLKEVIDELKEKGINYTTAEPSDMAYEEINAKIQSLQKKMDSLGLVNMRAIEAYDELVEKENSLKEKLETLEKEKTEIQQRMTGYENLKKETFMKTYNAVNAHFGEIFTELTDGTGRLVLENEENPFEGGLTLEGQQRDKKKQKLAGMSGGEKTLMALSLVFAVQRYMPAPFYALDEVDAALDGFNVERIAKMIIRQSKMTQFVVISQRSQMVDSSDRIIGVAQRSKGVTEIKGATMRKQEALAG